MHTLDLRAVLRSLTLSVLVSAGGCAVIPEYPGTLPPLEPADTATGVCPDVSGTYAEPGQMVSEDGKSWGTVYLSHVLAGGRSGERDWHPYPPIQRSAEIEVSMPDPQTIRVTSVQDGVRSRGFSQSLLTKDVYMTHGDRAVGRYFICERGFVRLARQYNFGSEIPGVINLSSDFLWLRRATDGSLIVLHRYGEGALVVVVPVGTSGTVWYRFSPTQP